MSTLVIVLVCVVVLLLVSLFFVLFGMGKTIQDVKAQNAFEFDRLRKNLEESELRYLEVLRRELANVLMRSDLMAFETAFEKMREFEYHIRRDFQRGKIERSEAEMKLLTTKYPIFDDFDLFNSRHCVPYDLRFHGSDGVVERYTEISKFLVLKAIRNERPLYDDKEMEVGSRYIQELKNDALKKRLKEAISRYFKGRDAEKTYSDEDYDVFWNVRSDSPENIYAITVKSTGEYGTFNTFSDGKKDYENYYRTDKWFNEESAERL